MNAAVKYFPRSLAVGLLLLLAGLALALVLAGFKSREAESRPMPVYGRVADFTLTNQLGTVVTRSDLEGHVWVADIIFTRCAGPCLRMSRQMQELQAALPARSSVRLVSLTTDPEFDTPPVLLKYAGRFGADPGRWQFLTGAKREIGALATESLKLSAVPIRPVDRASPADLFIHSTVLVVVDGRGQVRGVFETGGEGVSWAAEKEKLLGVVRQLERER